MWIIDEVLLGCGGTLQGNLRRNRSIGGFSIDSRSLAPNEVFIALSGPRFDGHDYVKQAAQKGASGALVSRAAFKARAAGWRALLDGFSFILVDDPLAALQALAAWHRRRFNLPLVAISGSNGKTTTKEMTASILKQGGRVLKNEGNLNNHIGLPLTLLNLNKDHRVAVLEMGINKRGEMQRLCTIARPTIGLITNIGAAHLEGLGDLKGVAKEKTLLFESVKEKGTAVINADDPFLKGWVVRAPRALTFGHDPEADLCAEDIVEETEAMLFKIRRKRTSDESDRIRLPVPGRHQISNALGAAAVASQLGFTLEDIRGGLAGFQAPPRRMEILRRKGVTILFDVYNANPDSMKAALQLLSDYPAEGPRIAVLGEMLELGPTAKTAHAAIGRTVAVLRIDRLIAVGPSADAAVQGALEGGMPKAALSSHVDLASAASAVKPLLKPGACLLIKGSRGMRMETLREELPDVL